MIKQIKCEQFIFGKLWGVKRARYEKIAWSSGITEELIDTIRKKFANCRPTTARISIFQGCYVASPINSELVALARIERSIEKEKGRSYLLQEHYIIFQRKDLYNNSGRLWLWFQNLSPPTPYFKYDDNLSNTLDIKEFLINQQIDKAIKFLLAQKHPSFGNSISLTLFHVLHKQKITSVFQQNDPYDRWIWLTALCMLLPPQTLLEHTLYIANESSIGWQPDLEVVCKSYSTSDRVMINSFSTNKMLTEYKNHKGYSDLICRSITSAEDIKAIASLFHDIEHLKLLDNKSTDSNLFNIAMLTIGLKLTRQDIEKEKFRLEDLHWLWRYASDNLNKQDVKLFFFILVQKSMEQWNSKDFKSFSLFLKEQPDAIYTSIQQIKNLNDGILLIHFLSIWVEQEKSLSESQQDFFIQQLQELINLQPKQTIKLLIKWLKTHHLEETISIVMEVFNTRTQVICLEQEQFWSLLLLLSNSIASINDLEIVTYILQYKLQSNGSKPVTNFFKALTKNSYKKNILKGTLDFAPDIIKQEICWEFLRLINYAKNESFFIEMIYIVSRLPSNSNILTIAQSGGEDWYYKNVTWILTSDNPSLFVAHLFLLHQVNQPRYKEKSLFNLLQGNYILSFSQIITALQDLKASREVFTLSVPFLSKKSPTIQISTLATFALSIQPLDLDLLPEEIELFQHALFETTEFDLLSSSIYEQIHQYFARKLKGFRHQPEWDICGNLLELHLKAEIVNDDFLSAKRVLKSLNNHIMLQVYTTYSYKLSLMKGRLLLKKLAQIDDQRRNEILMEFARSPLAYQLNIKEVSLFNRFIQDGTVRLFLFQKTISLK